MKLPTPEQIAGLSSTDHITRDYQDELRRMGRASLYFFARYLFGRTGLCERAHKPLCDAAQSIITKPNGFGVFEDPRATGKTHAITIPGPAWCLIQDETECRQRGWLPLGASTSILVASYKTPIAAIFTDMTRRIMEENPVFRWLWGDLIPTAEANGRRPTWSKEMFTVNRPGGSGYSVMATGTECGSTSLHPSVMFIDDLINETNYNSSTEVASQVEWLEHSSNLTDIMRGSRVVVENSWTERDPNHAMREKNREHPHSVFFFSRARVVCDLCEKGRSLDQHGNPIPCGEGFEHPLAARPLIDVFPSDPTVPYTMEDVRQLYAKLPSTIRWAQHENNPLARAELKWREEWLRYFTLERDPNGGDAEFLVLLTGKGGLRGATHEPDPERLRWISPLDIDVTVALDPGIHRPGLACAGRVRVPDLGELLVILECSTDGLKPRDQFFKMFDWVRRWGARRLAFESVGLQQYIMQTIPAMAEAYERERGVTLPYWVKRPNPDAKRIIGVQVYKREGDKIARTDAALSPFAEQRLICVRRDCRAFLDEYTIFDKGKFMDGLEAVVMCVKSWSPQRPATQDEMAIAGLRARQERETYEASQTGAIGYGEGI